MQNRLDKCARSNTRFIPNAGMRSTTTYPTEHHFPLVPVGVCQYQVHPHHPMTPRVTNAAFQSHTTAICIPIDVLRNSVPQFEHAQSKWRCKLTCAKMLNFLTLPACAAAERLTAVAGARSSAAAAPARTGLMELGLGRASGAWHLAAVAKRSSRSQRLFQGRTSSVILARA